MEFLVYHSANHMDMLSFLNEENIPSTVSLRNYQLVAVVDVENLEDAYRVTNHIDEPWWNNSEVKDYRQSRSSSVGDLIIDNVNKKGFLVAGVGWHEVQITE